MIFFFRPKSSQSSLDLNSSLTAQLPFVSRCICSDHVMWKWKICLSPVYDRVCFLTVYLYLEVASNEVDLFKFQLSYHSNPLQDTCPITFAVLGHLIRTHVLLILLHWDKKSYRLSEKCATLENGCKHGRIILKFDWRLDSTAAKMPVKF